MRGMKLFVLGVILGVLALTAGKSGVAQLVCTVPSPSYPQIQVAINDLACAVITISSGTYQESLRIARDNLELRGAGRDQTIINGGEGSEPVIMVSGAKNVTITSLELRNGRLGLQLRAALLATVANLSILQNQGDGLQMLFESSAEIRDNVIQKNRGNGISISGNSKTFLTDNRILENEGCGLQADDSSSGNLSGTPTNVLRGNKAGDLCNAPTSLRKPGLTNLQVEPRSWTNQNRFTVNWENPSPPPNIVAAWYKLGTPPSSSTDGMRMTDKPFMVQATSEGGQSLYVWLEAEGGIPDHDNYGTATLLLDQTPPSGVLIINDGANETSSLNVTLRLQASDAASGVALMRFSNDGSRWSDWQNFAETRSWDLSQFGGNPNQGTKTVYAQVRDQAGNESQIFTAQVSYVLRLLRVPQDTRTIQEAIDRISPGGTIEIASGTYRESLTIKDKALTLRGTGLDQTVIDGSGLQGNGILIYGTSQVTIQGLTIRNFRIDYDGRSGFNSNGVKVIKSSSVTIQDSWIVDNGSGIDFEDSSKVTLIRSRVTNNIHRSGFTFSISGCCDLTILDSVISNGNRNNILIFGDRTIIENSLISDSWDGISFYRGVAEMRGNVIRNIQGCGVFVSAEAQVQGSRNEMRDNGSDLCGYAPASLRQPLVAQTDRTQLAVPGDYVSLQEAVDAIAPGGTILVQAGSYNVGLTIWKSLTLRGVGTEQTMLKPLSERSSVISMIAEVKGVSLEGLAVTGEREGGNVSFTNADGLIIYGDTTLKFVRVSGFKSNAGISLNGLAFVHLENSTISRNYWGISVSDSAHVTIENSQITDNQDHGVVSFGAPVIQIRNSEISSNDNGLFLDGATVTIENSQIFGNRGDGLSLSSDVARAHILNNIIRDNKFYGIYASAPDNIVECRGNNVTNNGLGNFYPPELAQKCQ